MYIGVVIATLTIFCDFNVIRCLGLAVESGLAFSPPRPYLRRIKVKNRISRDERKRRSEFSKQLHKELRMKYWRRIDPKINEILKFDDPLAESYDLDPKRGFVVQEVIPRMVYVSDSLKPLPLDESRSEEFDRQAGLQFLANIAAVTGVFVKEFESRKGLSFLSEMGPSELLTRLETDISYISSLLNVEQQSLSRSCLEYVEFLKSLCEKSEIRFLSQCYVFFKEWHVSKKTLLTNLRDHLRLVNKLKCSFYDPDARNLEGVLNLMASEWTRRQKDEFLNEIPLAYQKLSESLVMPFV
ncbi:conserved hypothetical protein [Theileria orientalis strain Shintoku]|uniref:Uncharacterized protein n=1 Tax=Theileria orientalis strain Shintoku TaxID=869250 RepID=J4C2V8_THEOR|nr:conserved hypothetical protein [Theileria orientalis strain Shintoku]BAM39366.1 conserved hypothetical protein [Theileria orientalis strain Shintoku]|eukprot:XP_009689667.1 conserved hypothetical protein [Theileria orientalis strain Shintoku]